ncbi:diguanylate cyclase domain-containing protein [Bordetella sp. FB-8]|uniref:diguanylate cyclase domain-containing protein n=1 Tax=Bordetella sp. FB-8 TaxID=1159870 RepID=UPI00035E9DEC|nr:diguanylate cyclase [Bordetella sp. FB-8]
MSVGPTGYDELAMLRLQLERERQARLDAEIYLEDGLRELYLRRQENSLLEAITADVDQAVDTDIVLASALERICRHVVWPVGHIFFVDDGQLQAEPQLSSSGIWFCLDAHRFALLRAASVEDEDAIYDGLPGQVLGTGRPAWLADITQDIDFSRAALARQAGLRAAYGFPVLAGREVVAVLEFFSERDDEPTASLLCNMSQIGVQLGRMIGPRGIGAAARLGAQEKTAQRNARLREQVHLMDDILASIAQGVAYEDAQGYLHSYNRQFLELLDISKNYAASLPAMPDVTRAFLDPAKRKALFVLNGKSSDDTGWERLDGDLNGYEWDNSKNYILDMMSGYVVEIRRHPLARGGHVWVFTDVTHHIYTQESLRESEARWRSLTHLSADLYWEMDSDLRITKLEGQGTSNMQYMSSFLGRKVCMLPGIRDKSADLERQRTLMDAHRSFHELELALPDGNGERVWVSVSGEPKCDADGRFAGYRGVMRDITEKKRAQDEIRQLAFYDELTGLPNRRLMYDRLERAQAASARDGTHGALMFIDLDNFKKINDTLGHKCGDQLLVQVAARLRDSLRTRDTLSRLGNDDAARLGGDEFVVVLDGLAGGLEQACMKAGIVAHKVLSALNLSYDLDGQQVRSTPSIGVALFQGRGHDMAELMRRADLAMYQAKSQGRNAVCFYTVDM